jgi:tetratricopeptide (TPR) repeat protein
LIAPEIDMPPAIFPPPLSQRLARISPGVGHYLFAFVFLVRLIALTRLASSPFLLPSGSDMHFYDDWARQILHGQWTDHHAFYGLPLYPFLLAFFYRIFGYSPFVPGFFQAGLDAGTSVLIYRIAWQILRTGNRSKVATVTAVGAGLGWCFFVSAQAYSIILMPTSLAVFVLWLLIWQLVRTNVTPSFSRSLIFGLLIGIMAMGIATILVIVPLFLWAIFARPLSRPNLSPFRLRTTAAFLFMVGIVAGTAPCWLHNYFVAHDRVFLSAHGGINLWLGNNPDATGYPRFPGLHAAQSQMLRDSITIAEAAAGRTLKRSEVSQYWSAKARSYIADNPIPWLKLMTRKVANFWNAFEYDDIGVIAALRERRIVFPGLEFAVVAALALPGLLFGLWIFANSRPVAVAILLHFAAVLPTFVTERYRIGVVPGLLVFAAIGLSELWTDWSLGRIRRVIVYFITLLVGLWIVTMPRTDPGLWAVRFYNAGRAALDAGDLVRAQELLSDAQAYAPDSAEVNFVLGNLRLAQGSRPAAFSFYSTVLRMDPAHNGALTNIGVMTLDDGKFAEAAAYFRKALEQPPTSAKTYYLLAKAELALGNFEDAKATLARALEMEPERPEYRNLEKELEQHGQ